MGDLHLCSHKLASVPYHIENIALNIYSLEELCYYLKENIELADSSFMDDKLICWIRDELDLPSLAENLASKKKSGSLPEFVETAVCGCNYFSKEETAALKEAMADFAKKDEADRRKIRADRLLQKKRYGASILEYYKILETPGVNKAFAGNIYHNLGTAYAGLFFFQEAADCYQKAFLRNNNPLSLKQYQAALRLSKEGAAPNQAEETDIPLPKETLLQWKETYRKNCK